MGPPASPTSPAPRWWPCRTCRSRSGAGGRQVQAVRGVTLQVAPGEILGLVGESGSGKSVLGLSLLGLLPTSPAPEVDGLGLWSAAPTWSTASPEQRRLLRRQHLGAVFQDPMTSLNPTMRVGRQVAEAAGDGQSASTCSRRSGSPMPGAGPRPSRTSCRAACASG